MHLDRGRDQKGQQADDAQKDANRQTDYEWTFSDTELQNTAEDWPDFSVVAATLSVTNQAPTFLLQSYTVSVPEEDLPDALVFSFSVSDADSDPLSYGLAGPDHDSFYFNSSSPTEVLWRNAPNFEEQETYEFTLGARDGFESRSVPVTVNVTDVWETPEQPTAPTVSAARGLTGILVTWTEPANPGPPINGYNLQFRESNSNQWRNRNGVEHVNESYTIEGLKEDTSYDVGVKALTPEGDSSFSEPGTGKTNSASSLPEAPAAPTAVPAGMNALDVSWSPPSDQGDSAITGYDLRYRKGLEPESDSIVMAVGLSGSARITGLEPHTAYVAEVRAGNSHGDGDWSESVSRRTGVAARSVPLDWGLLPTGLRVGDSFRLLFVTSTSRNAASDDVAVYNRFVQDSAAAGHAGIRRYSDDFRAVVGVYQQPAVHPVDNTVTRYADAARGLPIYWLDGSKVADDYADFYDGDWDEEGDGRDESGEVHEFAAREYDSGADNESVWTGKRGERPVEVRARLSLPPCWAVPTIQALAPVPLTPPARSVRTVCFRSWPCRRSSLWIRPGRRRIHQRRTQRK